MISRYDKICSFLFYLRCLQAPLIFCVSLAAFACAAALSSPDLQGALAVPPLPFVYPKCSEEMRQYFLQRYIMFIGGPLICAATMCLFLNSKAAEKLRCRLRRIRSYGLGLFLTAAVVYLLGSLIRFPLDIYSSFMLEHRFGLSNQSLASWLKDDIGHIFIGAVFVPISIICFLIIRKFGRGWFLPVWFFLSVAIILLTFLEPLAVEPVFNKFHPLPDCRLKSRIESLCRQSGIAKPLVLVADKSRQTRKLNAFVSGFSASKRIVLFDNLVNEVPEEQILAVVAHELGHYRLKHVVIGLLLCVFSLLPALYFVEWCICRFLKYLPSRWDIRSSSDPLLLAVYCMVVWLAPLIYAPLPSFVSRLLEAEADSYSIRLTKNPLAAARLFCALSERNLTDPDPPAFFEFWFFSHPSLKHRIDYALSRMKQD